jgi:hypothetical protein
MPSVIDFYSETNYKFDISIYAGAQIQRGQSFTGNGKQISSVKFYLSKTGLPTGNAYGVLWTHSGVFGTSSIGANPQLALSNPIDVSTFGTSKALVEFTFPTPYTSVADAKYVTTIYFVNGNITNCVKVGVDNSGATHPGNASYVNADGSWHVESAGVDTIFYVYGVSNFVPQIIVN